MRRDRQNIPKIHFEVLYNVCLWVVSCWVNLWSADVFFSVFAPAAMSKYLQLIYPKWEKMILRFSRRLLSGFEDLFLKSCLGLLCLCFHVEQLKRSLTAFDSSRLRNAVCNIINTLTLWRLVDPCSVFVINMVQCRTKNLIENKQLCNNQQVSAWEIKINRLCCLNVS